MTDAKPARILVVDHDQDIRAVATLAINYRRYVADFADTVPDAIRYLKRFGNRYTAIVLDVTVAGGIADLLYEAKYVCGIPVIALVDSTTPSQPEFDVMLYRPVDGLRLQQAMQQCMNQVKEPDPDGSPSIAIRHVSGKWQNDFQQHVRRMAECDVPVLVQGETGSGKEVLARQLHAFSPRAKKPFLKVNCAALPSELIESELFGYDRGAFTGAFKSTLGKFESANGGTILLDEIGDMDFKLQAKLLQVLQDKEFIRLGSSEVRKVDVRVIAATHCNLEKAITEGRFRQDLYYRLNVIHVEVPPLRERKNEIMPLAHHFLRRYGGDEVLEISPRLSEVLVSHSWPGNIRELENVTRRLIVFPDCDAMADALMAMREPKLAAVAAASPSTSANRSNPASGSLTRSNAPAMLPTPGVPTSFSPSGNVHDWPAPASVTSEATSVQRTSPQPPNGASQPHWSVLARAEEIHREAEAEAILSALNSVLWNRKRAAVLLKLEYKALLYKMKRLGIVERAKIAG